MGRTQAFERDDVIRAARTLFWQVGFEDAAIPDLERATGLSRSSIYNAFGSKRGLFDAAVQSYLDEIIRPRLKPLQADAVDPDAVREYLRGLRDALQRLDSLSAANGCLLINAAGAPIARDPGVAAVIADYRAELHAAIARGIRARRTDLDAAARERLAEAVTSLVVAALAFARIDAAQAVHSIDTALDIV